MTSQSQPVLIGCSHGTANLDGRAVVAGILDDVRALRPELDVREAFVDVQEPEVADVVAAALAEQNAHGERTGTAGAVVVPLLLSPGFHTFVDIASAVEGRQAQATLTLGPDARLADILLDRLRSAGARPDDAVILAAAGSSDHRALAVVQEMHALLTEHWAGHVLIAYGAVAQPSVPEVVAQARAAGAARVVIASYLLAPGHFHDRLLQAGADIVTEPLGPDPRLAAIVLDRYDGAESVR